MPAADEPDGAAAGGVEADVGRRDDGDGERRQRQHEADHEGDVSATGPSPTARIGIIGIAQRSGQPKTAAPGGCI